MAKRGVIWFQGKAENVFRVGAAGMVDYNSTLGIFQRILSDESESPVISIRGANGAAIEELLADSYVEEFFNLILGEQLSQNVMVEKQGTGESIGVLDGH